MARHVDDLIARAREEALSGREHTVVQQHLAACARCADLARAMERADALLEHPVAVGGLAPLRPTRPAPGALLRTGLVLATVASSVVLAATLSGLLRPSGFPASAAASPTSAPARAAIITAHRKVLESGPGGMPTIVTDAFDGFRLLEPDGTATDSSIVGVTVGAPAFDGTGQVAYWSRTAMDAGPYRLMVWSARTKQERVLLDDASLRPAGDPVWTADGRALFVGVRRSDGRGQLQRVDASSGTATVLADGDAAAGITLLYADPSVVVGLRAGSYVVVDARSGAMRSEVPLRAPAGNLFETDPSGIVVELVRNFEAPAGPLRVWSASDPAKTLGVVDERGVESPLPWPGRGEVVYAIGARVVAYDYRAGTTRDLQQFSDSVRLLGLDAGGTLLALRGPGGLQVFERDDAGLHLRTDLRFTFADPSLYEPIGLIRV